MGLNCKCYNCEAEFEITITDYVLANGEPDVTYCPNCGKATLEL